VSQLLLATTNPGKIREIRVALGALPVQLLTLAEVGAIEEPEETGATFAENARQKAEYYSLHSGMLTVAEDSGLVIDALGGRPGVHSARYPGETYAEKFDLLYDELAPHPRPWTARFTCALVLWHDGRQVFGAEGSVEGEIVRNPRGANGFGYDPIFFYPPYGRTLADVSDEKKLAASHRGKAFRQLREWLTDDDAGGCFRRGAH
jgi:XTP/dITP diphosphohydrolase